MRYEIRSEIVRTGCVSASYIHYIYDKHEERVINLRGSEPLVFANDEHAKDFIAAMNLGHRYRKMKGEYDEFEGNGNK